MKTFDEQFKNKMAEKSQKDIDNDNFVSEEKMEEFLNQSNILDTWDLMNEVLGDDFNQKKRLILHEIVKTATENAYKQGQTYNISEWKRIGEERGYFKYFKKLK